MNTLTYSIRLEFKSKEEENSLIDLLLEHQKVWNYMSEIAFKMKKIDKKMLYDRTYHNCRKMFPNCPRIPCSRKISFC